MRTTVLLSLALLAGCTGGSTPAPGPTAADVDKRVKEEVAKALAAERKRVADQAAKGEAKRAAEAKKAAVAAKPKEWTFDEAWEEAKRISEELDRAEPKATADAIAKMGVLDAGNARQFSTAVRENGINYIYQEQLSKYGLTDALRRAWRAKAFDDKTHVSLKSTCRKFWQKSFNPADIVSAAEAWGAAGPTDMFAIPDALMKDEKPYTTAAALLIAAVPGGEAWLKTHE